MAITTMAQVIAGIRDPEEIFKTGVGKEANLTLQSTFYMTGRPGAAVAPTPGLNGAHLTTYAGQIPFVNPVTGNTYLARLVVAARDFPLGTPSAMSVMLVDRLWHNSSIVMTTTTAQNITFGTPVSRDANGAALGDGVMVGLEVSTVTGNAGAITNTTISYTNQAGTAGKVGTITSFPITGVASFFVSFQLAAGDTGVRSIQSITLGTSYVSGTMHLVTYRTLAQLGVEGIGEVVIDAITSGFPRLYNDTVPFFLFSTNTTNATILTAQVVYTQG